MNPKGFIYLTEVIIIYWFIDASTNYHYLCRFSLQIATWNLSMAASFLILPWTITLGFMVADLQRCNLLFYCLTVFNLAGTMGIIALIVLFFIFIPKIWFIIPWTYLSFWMLVITPITTFILILSLGKFPFPKTDKLSS